MKRPTDWELPLDIVDPSTKHGIGRVYRDGLFIAFESIDNALYELNGPDTIMETSHGLHLRLSSDNISPWRAAFGKLVSKFIFDECLIGETAFEQEEPYFDRLRLPLPNIMEYLGVWPITEEHLADGGMTINAKDFKRFDFELPTINAKGHFRFCYHWSSRTFVEQKFIAQAEVAIEYDSPVQLSMVKDHEEWLRSFFDYIWFRGHRSGMLYLHNGRKRSQLLRRESVTNEVKVARSSDFQDILTHENLTGWLERWFALSEAQRLAIQPVVSLARNPGIITDMKFVMALHATDALVQNLRNTTSKDSDMSPRLLNHIGRMWQHKPLLNKSLKDYIEHLVWTRNDILKAVRHPKATLENRLTALERASAYFELLLLHKALFLELMGINRGEIDCFVEKGFRTIALQEFRHFRD